MLHTAATRSPISSHDDGSASASSRFPPVSLSRARLDAFHSDAHKALAQTLSEFTQLDHTGVDSQRWKYMRSRGGISVYLDRQQEVNTQNSLLLAAGTVKARMADVMEGLYMDTSEDSRLVQHRIHTRFVDAEVLKVVERRSPEHPYNFTGLKWALLKTSSTGIVSNRDLCFLEKLGTIEIAGGRKLGYFIMQSVNLRECPPSPSSKIVRAHLSLCYLFEETKNGMLGVYMTGSMISFGPKMLWKFARNNFADIVISIGRAVRLARAKRYARLLRSKHERQGFRSQRPSGECALCHSPASFFERHRECMGCHRVSVCKKCRGKQDIFLREDHVSLNLARATFCNECIQSVHNPEPPRSPVFAPQHSMVSVSAQRTPGTSCYQPARIFKQESFASTNPSTTSSSMSGSGYEDLDRDRDSERSLRMFDIRMRQEFEDAGFDETDEVSRLTVLAMLGSGERVRDSVNDRESGATSTSFASSCFSFDDRDDDVDVDIDADDQDDDDREDELVQSVILVQRSLQPPEMLERQKLRRDGSLRPQARSLPNVAEDEDATRALFSRLQQVSKLAEQTHEFAKQQTWRAEELFSTPPRPQANHRSRQPGYRP